MKRDELEHVLRASAAITRDNSFVVIGSQAVLLPHPDAPAELLPDTATMPDDWMTFAKLYYLGDNQEITVVCPDLHDIAVSKCVAGRDKDAQWVAALLRHQLIELPRLLGRLKALATKGVQTDRLVAWAQRRAQEAQP
jgi:hypothetical protein